MLKILKNIVIEIEKKLKITNKFNKSKMEISNK